MDYFQANIQCKTSQDIEVVSALLQTTDMDSVWEKNDGVIAYYKATDYQSPEELLSSLNDLFQLQDVEIDCSLMENKNWNAQWESNFDTVKIDNFCFIYADFHEKEEGFDHYIKIAPKMAFGTGHHETTYMMMKKMGKLNFDSTKVLDLGCGSGILSVLASQLGANDIDAIDIEQPSYENTLEHAEMNNVKINAFCGRVEDVPRTSYNVVLANINRGVLLDYVDTIKSLVKTNGMLLLSGILKKDKDLILKAYSDMTLVDIDNKGKWLCFEYTKN